MLWSKECYGLWFYTFYLEIWSHSVIASFTPAKYGLSLYVFRAIELRHWAWLCHLDEIKEGSSWLLLPKCCPGSEAEICVACPLRGQGATKKRLCHPHPAPPSLPGWCWDREGRTGQWQWQVSVRGGFSCLESTRSLTNHFHMMRIRLFGILLC